VVAVKHINWLTFIVLAALNTNAQAQALSGIVINVRDGDTLTILIDGQPTLGPTSQTSAHQQGVTPDLTRTNHTSRSLWP